MATATSEKGHYVAGGHAHRERLGGILRHYYREAV